MLRNAAAASAQSCTESSAPAGGHTDKCDDAGDADGRASMHGAVYDADVEEDEATAVSSAAQIHSNDQQSSAGAALTKAAHCASVASGRAAHEADEADVPCALRVRGHHCMYDESEDGDKEAVVLSVLAVSASNEIEASRMSGCEAGHSSGTEAHDPSMPVKDDDDACGVDGANSEAAAVGVVTMAEREVLGAVALPIDANSDSPPPQANRSPTEDDHDHYEDTDDSADDECPARHGCSSSSSTDPVTRIDARSGDGAPREQ
jgi:hypothetical protein